jgi:hypothetical protein
MTTSLEAWRRVFAARCVILHPAILQSAKPAIGGAPRETAETSLAE